MRSILNKLTPQKFQTLTKQLIDLCEDIDTPKRLERFVDLIFEKVNILLSLNLLHTNSI